MNQMEYFEILVRQLREPGNVEQAMAWAGTATREQISEQIDRLKAERDSDGTRHDAKTERIAAAYNADPLEIGMYRKTDGRMFRVYPARNGGHLLCKELVPDSEPGWSKDCKWSFEYRGAAHRFVSANERMTLEEAKRFGHDFGVCCCCGALLTDPDSVARGIGPVCASKV